MIIQFPPAKHQCLLHSIIPYSTAQGYLCAPCAVTSITLHIVYTKDLCVSYKCHNKQQSNITFSIQTDVHRYSFSTSFCWITVVKNYFEPDGNTTGRTKWYGEVAAAVGNVDTLWLPQHLSCYSYVGGQGLTDISYELLYLPKCKMTLIKDSPPPK